MPTEQPERLLQLGRLGRAVGLDGGIRFHPLGQHEAALLTEGTEVLLNGREELTVSSVRQQGKGLVVHFRSIRRVERARELTHAELSIRSGDLPEELDLMELGAGLIGLPVEVDGQRIGTVSGVSGLPGHEYLELEPGGQLLPLNAPYVTVGRALITVSDPPEGLL